MTVACATWKRRRLGPLALTLTLLWALPAAADQIKHALPDTIALLLDLSYRQGKSAAWKLDLAYPKAVAPKPRPALVIIHGGGWREGDKSSFSSLEHWAPGNVVDFAKLGFVAATINYRLSGEAPFPAAVEDCKCAVRWLRAHANDYHIDPDRIGAFGNSAGGHLALLLGMAGKGAGLEGDGPYREYSSLVQAVVSDSGPVDLDFKKPANSGLSRVMAQFMGGPAETLAERTRKASPVSYSAGAVPPLLLIYGTVDSQVTVGPVDEWVVALQRAGAKDVTYLRLGLANHCPYSLGKTEHLFPLVDDFFLRTLMRH